MFSRGYHGIVKRPDIGHDFLHPRVLFILHLGEAFVHSSGHVFQSVSLSLHYPFIAMFNLFNVLFQLFGGHGQ